MRLVNQFGNIYEGSIDKSGRINGFGICYLGTKNLIDFGWYENSIVHGNWMRLNGEDLTIMNESGWYQDGIRVSKMKSHSKLKNFTINNIFKEISFNEQCPDI